MSLPRRLAVLVLALLAVLTGIAVYQLRRVPETPAFTGPPRSDYTLEAFQLVTLDASGAEAFSAEGPRLARHPFLGTLSIEQPRLRFPDSEGRVWNGRAAAATVSADAELVELRGDVLVQGPQDGANAGPALRGEQLNLYPGENRVASPGPVTLSGPGSILRGRALEADLDTRRFDLADVSGRYE